MSGSYRVAETYSDDQYSEITVTATPSVWIAATVRNQPGGDLYLGLYVWNGASSYMQIFKRISGVYTSLGPAYTCGILPVGTKLRLEVVGGTLAFMQDGGRQESGIRRINHLRGTRDRNLPGTTRRMIGLGATQPLMPNISQRTQTGLKVTP